MRTKTLLGATAAAGLVASVLAGAGPAWAANPHHGGRGVTTTGINVSYPQCPGTSLPADEAFAVVGVNGGLANDYNTCLGNEYAYAESSTGASKQAKAQLYLNTADPGNTVADWPSPGQLGSFGQQTSVTDPYGSCGYASASGTGPGAETAACAYVYGYDMVAGIAYSGGNVVGDLSWFTTTTGQALYDDPVWLDVETGNTWQSGTGGLTMNVADLQGMVAAVDAAAAAAGATPQPVGVYSTSSQWGQITGSPTGTAAGSLAGRPVWIPGARSEGGAASNCSLASFTGGTVTLTQWFANPYDGDYSCTG